MFDRIYRTYLEMSFLIILAIHISNGSYFWVEHFECVEIEMYVLIKHLKWLGLKLK